jgi:tRNA threonylcarbamoyladenosine biosynthesis protein TsaB
MTLPGLLTGSSAEGSIRVLAFDTTTDSGSVALLDHDRVMGEYLFPGARAHSERLLVMIDRLLADSGCSMADIDLIAVSLGPGSFTGLRVGISTAQGMALAAGKALLGVPTLEVMAYQARGCGEQICPMISARGQEVFTGLYRFSGQGDLQQLRAETVMEIAAWLSGISGETVFLGSGAVLHRNLIASLSGARVLTAVAGIPRASAVAALAQSRYQGPQAHAPDALAPHYLRLPDAERLSGQAASLPRQAETGIDGK